MVDATFPTLRDRHEQENVAALTGLFSDLRDDVLARFDAGARVLLAQWWDDRVADVIFTRNFTTAQDVAELVVASFPDDAPFDADLMVQWFTEQARVSAVYMNQVTRLALDDADGVEAVRGVLDELSGSRSARFARGMVQTSANFAATDAARTQGARVKSWQVNSTNPRSAHRSVNNETVPIAGKFSNGLRWPGDPQGDPDDVAGCRCTVRYM